LVYISQADTRNISFLPEKKQENNTAIINVLNPVGQFIKTKIEE
jgi:hypothetical protein